MPIARIKQVGEKVRISTMTTERIVERFVRGESMVDIAKKIHWPVVQVEKAIRRWMYIYPRGKGNV